MGNEHLAQATRRAAGEVFHVGAQDLEDALADRRAERSDGLRRVGRQPDAHEVLGGLLVVDGDGLHGAPADLSRQRCDLGLGDELGAGDVVDAVLVALPGERRGRRGGAVLARDVGRRAVAVVVHEMPGGHGPRRRRDLRLRVEPHAQRRPAQAAVADGLLARAVVVGHHQRQLAARVQARRVEHVADARRGRRVDGGRVLGDAVAEHVDADEQQTVDAGEGRGQRSGRVEVAEAYGRAALGEVEQVVGTAGDEHDVFGRAAVEDQLGGEPAEVPGGAGDGDRHVLPICSGGREPTRRWRRRPAG
jgi:hypothetical protein